jgi:hypothetical protein
MISVLHPAGITTSRPAWCGRLMCRSSGPQLSFCRRSLIHGLRLKKRVVDSMMASTLGACYFYRHRADEINVNYSPNYLPHEPHGLCRPTQVCWKKNSWTWSRTASFSWFCMRKAIVLLYVRYFFDVISYWKKICGQKQTFLCTDQRHRPICADCTLYSYMFVRQFQRTYRMKQRKPHASAQVFDRVAQLFPMLWWQCQRPTMCSCIRSA